MTTQIVPLMQLCKRSFEEDIANKYVKEEPITQSPQQF